MVLDVAPAGDNPEAGDGVQPLSTRVSMEEIMAWTAPIIEEVTCGMEINMYFPAEDDGDLF
jgi:coenzyme PQQ precursor peptide PqqA